MDTRTTVRVLAARTADQVPRQFETAITAGAGGMLVVADPLIYSLRRQIPDLAAKARIPAMYPSRDFIAEGGLMSYGFDRRQIYRRAAEHVDKILKGTKPANLPVEQPTKSELAINLKAATALGLDPAVAAAARRSDDRVATLNVPTSNEHSVLSLT